MVARIIFHVLLIVVLVVLLWSGNQCLNEPTEGSLVDFVGCTVDVIGSGTGAAGETKRDLPVRPAPPRLPLPAPISVPELPLWWPIAAREVSMAYQPVRIGRSDPVYPPYAWRERLQGDVELEAQVGRGGRVLGATVVCSIPVLDDAASVAVEQFEYQPIPPEVDVPVMTREIVSFRRPGGRTLLCEP